jgi:hypothetical protein
MAISVDKKQSPNAKKQAAHRARLAEKGIKTRTVTIPSHLEAELVQIAHFLVDHPDFRFGPLMSPAGKLVNPFKPLGAKGRKAKRAEAAAIRAAKNNTQHSAVVA